MNNQIMRTVALLLTILLLSCKKEKWEKLWEKDNASLKEVVELLKHDKLKKIYGRSGYKIPDSFNLRSPYNGLAIRETDFTYDGTYSIVFYFEDTSSTSRVKPAFVYTNSQKRIDEYQKGYSMAEKLEQYWYYSYR